MAYLAHSRETSCHISYLSKMTLSWNERKQILMTEFSQCNYFLSVKLPCPSLAEATLDPPIGFTLLALRSCLLHPAYHTSPSPSSQLKSISMASIPSTPTCHRFLSCALYERMCSLYSSTSSRGNSVLPRSAGRHGGGECGKSRLPILLPNGFHWKPAFCYPLPFKPHPVQLHPRLHCLSKEVTIISLTPLHHSTLSTDSFLSLLKHLWDTLVATCLSTILYQDPSCSTVLASNPSTILVQLVSISVSHSLCDFDKSSNFPVQNEMPSTSATTRFIPQPVLLPEFKSQLMSPTIIHIKKKPGDLFLAPPSFTPPQSLDSLSWRFLLSITWIMLSILLFSNHLS